MNGSAVRLAVFLSLWAILALVEYKVPRHVGPAHRPMRWRINAGLAVIDTLCLRLLMPWLAVDAALWAARNQVGLLHAVSLPVWLSAAIGFLSLDVLIYFQHRLMHAVPWLWRLHRMHHTDLALDVSSGTRFHPLEIIMSMLIKIAAVIVLGVGPAVVLVFELILSSFALVTHSNIAIPERWDKALRCMLVTPDMHRIHHSIDGTEHNLNFCFHVSWWDRLFGTYRSMPANSQASMTLGLTEFREANEQKLWALIKNPFLGKAAAL